MNLQNPPLIMENLNYKANDHIFRAQDEYAQAKYDITTRWLGGEIGLNQCLINIGCGSGEYNHVATEMGLQVLGCEPESEAFQMSLRNKPSFGCDIRNCGIFELLGQTDPADFIVMHDVLEHIEDEKKTVAALARLVKKGGVVVLSVPALNWLFGQHDRQLGHFRRYTKASLLPLFQGEFEVEKARYFGLIFIPITLWFSKIKKIPYPISQASRGIIHRVMRWVCQLESRIPLPLGTSVLVKLRKL